MEEQKQETASTPVAPAAPKADSQDVEKNKTMAILAYIIFFLPLLAAKDSKFAMFHANQGLNLFLFWIVGSIASWVVAGILAITIILIPLAGLVPFVVPVAGIVFLIMGMLGASKGEMKPLPVIGKFNLIK